MIRIANQLMAYAAATIALGAHSAGAQAFTEAESRAFDRGDRESRALMASITCLDRLAVAVRDKRVVAYEQWMVARQCLVIEGHYVWIALGGDTTSMRPTRMSAYDLSTGAVYAGAIDTARVAAVARAEWSGTNALAKQFEDAKRPGVPLTFRFDGDSIEVWLLPLPLLSGNPWSLGGERGAVYSPDGRRRVREIDEFARSRTATVPDTGTVRIPAPESRVPSLSEFLLANELNARGRDIVIELKGITSALSSKPGAPWLQVVRR